MLRKLSHCFVLFWGLSSISWAQESKNNTYQKECFQHLNALKKSYQDTSNHGISFSMVIVKESKNWLVIVTDTGNYYSFKKIPKVDTLIPNSAFFDAGLCKLLEPKTLILKEKKVQLGDLKFTQYYSFVRKKRRAYQALEALETGNRTKNIIERAIQGIGQLFNFKPPKMDTKALENLKKMGDEVKKMQATIKKLEEENQKLKTQLNPSDKPKSDSASVEKTKKESNNQTNTKNSNAEIPSKDNPKDTSIQKKNKEIIENKSSSKTKTIVNPKDTIVHKKNKETIPKNLNPEIQAKTRIDSINLQIDNVIRQINLHREITELQDKKLELLQKKTDLQNNNQKKSENDSPQITSLTERTAEINKLMSNLKSIMGQIKQSQDIELKNKLPLLEKQHQELSEELINIEKELQKQ